MANFSVTDLTPDEQDSLAEVRKKKAQLLEEIQQIQNEIEGVNSQIASLSVYEDDENSRLKLLASAKKKFNFNPKKGIQFIFDHGLLPAEPESVARFFYESDGLRKTSIGDYLGEKSDFNIAVLERYVFCHSFNGLTLVEALRTFLWNFRLPGEAQKIDRIMEHFAKHYCAQNPQVFDHPDTCYTLCYATIMLNTSLHNPSVKEKMTLENFLNMTGTMNVSRELIVTIFHSIRVEPFKLPDESEYESLTTFFQADKQGWLMKQGCRYKLWSKRWFVLTDKCLCYFEMNTDKEPRGVIPLENVRVRAVTDGEKSNARPHVFEIFSEKSDVVKACKANSNGGMIEGHHSVYRMAAHSHEEMLAWISAIQRGINKDLYFNMLQARRRRILGFASSEPALNKSLSSSSTTTT